MITIKGKYTTADIMIDNVEETLIAQIIKMVNHPSFTKPIKIMPDCHTGKTSCIGFTMELTDKVIPEVVSVDIGCGVLSAKTNLKNIDSHEIIDKEIREAIPFGYKWHDKDSVQYKENLKMIKALLDKYYEVE